MLKKILLLSFVLLIFSNLACAQTQFKLYIPSYEIAQSTSKIDIMVENAPQIGAMQFNLFYDPKIIEITKVSTGKLTSEAMIMENVDNRNGKATIGIISLNGFSGKGSISTLYVNIRGSKGDTSELKLSMDKKGVITDTKNKELNLPVLESGAIKVGGYRSYIHWIIAGLVVVVIIILIFVWMQKRKKRNQTI